MFLSLLPKTKGAHSQQGTTITEAEVQLNSVNIKNPYYLSVRHSLGMASLNKACNKHPSEVKMFFNTLFRSERASTCWSFDNQV